MKKDKRFGKLNHLDEDCLKLTGLIGKTIIDVGFIKDVCEGGLAIDYEEKGKHKRVILGFTELGMWVDWDGELGVLSEDDVLWEKLLNFCNDFNWDFDKTILKENARNLEYTIIGNVSLTLSIKDIKKIGYPDLMNEFGKKKKDLRVIVENLNEYIYGGETYS